MMDKDSDGQISQKEFLEYNLVMLGYSDVAVVNLINDVFHHLDYDGSGALSVDDLATGNHNRPNAEALLDELRIRHGIHSGDEHELPLGFFGMKLSFTRPTANVPDLWEGTSYPEGQLVIHTEHGDGTVTEVVDSGVRVVAFDSGVTKKLPRKDWEANMKIKGTRVNIAAGLVPEKSPVATGAVPNVQPSPRDPLNRSVG